MKKMLLSVLLVLISYVGFCQSKAYVVLNVWENTLTNFNPTSYLNDLSTVVQNRLSVKDILNDAASLTDTSSKEQLDQWVKGRIAKREQVGSNDYFIAISNQLNLPLINLSRFFFKNSVQTSRLVFYLNIYNAEGVKVVSDTIVSRGCIQNKTSDNKASKYFYDTYKAFAEDMQCHLQFIKQTLTADKFTFVNSKKTSG